MIDKTLMDAEVDNDSMQGDQYSVPEHKSGESITRAPTQLIEIDRRQLDAIVSAIPGGRDNIQDIYPLSPLQEGMLFHHLLSAENDTYVLSTLVRLEGIAQLDSFLKALQKVVDRHDVLRTAVWWEGLSSPVQVVTRRAILPVEELKLDPDRDAIVQFKELMTPGRCKLDLRQAPLIRLKFVVGERDAPSFAMLLVHHIVCDHQSLRLVVAEAMTCLQGREAELPAPVPYGDYVKRALVDVRMQESEAFFRCKLADIDEPTAPFGYVDVHDGGTEIIETCEDLEPALAEYLRLQARHQGVSAARLFHAAWALVVAITSGRDDVIFGTVVLAASQRRPLAQRMLGMSVNTLPLRVKLQNTSAKELLDQTHDGLQQLLKHQGTPLTLAQACSGVARTMPLFTAILNYRHSIPDLETDQVGDIGVQVLIRGEAWSNYPIALTVDDRGEGFSLTAQADRRIDPVRIVNFMRTALVALAQALERGSRDQVLSLSILPPAERRLVLEYFNATRREYAPEGVVHQLIEAQARRCPKAIALLCGDQQQTYGELNRRANQVARLLATFGVRPDMRVGVYLERSVDMVVAWLGILKAGGAYVPLDVNYPVERLAHILRDSAPLVVLTREGLRKGLPVYAPQLIAIDTATSGINHQEDTDLVPAALNLRPEHLAYVLYTSGSTGVPKGVMVEHRNLWNLIHWHAETFELSQDSGCSSVAAVGFDAAGWEIWPALSVGASVALAPSDLAGDAEKLLTWWAGQQLDVSFLPTPMAEFAFSRNLLNSGLRKLLVGGDQLRMRPTGQCFAVVNNYGPTECTVVATSGLIDDDTDVLNIGKPIANGQIYILNAHGQPVPVGVAGEIYIGGSGVARGYLNNEQLTNEHFIADRFTLDIHARIYKTGDIGRWTANGSIEYLGRNDQQVKIRGYRIELGEIEAQLAAHPLVRDAVVVVREDTPGEKRLAAYVTQRGEHAPRIEELRQHLKAVLPDYMVPSSFMNLQNLPLTSNGKLDRRALPSPEIADTVQREYEAPQGEVEEILASIWQGLLNVGNVGRHDNFFELGGHSLLIVQLMDRLRRIGMATSVRQVFDCATLAELAKALTDEVATHFEVPPNSIPPGCDSITPKMLPLVQFTPEQIERIVKLVPGGAPNVQDIYPLVPLQEGILFHHLYGGSSADTYVLPMLLAVSSRQRLDQLITALRQVIDRHDVMRTCVFWENIPLPVQVVHRVVDLPVTEAKLDGDRSSLEQVQQWMRPEYQRIELSRAPVLRLQVAADPHSERWFAMLQLHHIIADHVTLEILTSEIVNHLEGRAQQLVESAPYRNHVAQTLAYARHDAAEKFFRGKLADVDEPTTPFGLSGMINNSDHIEESSEVMERGLIRRVRAVARHCGVSAATLFHAAWGLVVAHTAGRDTVVFGTVLLGRLQVNANTQSTMGMFINTLPLRLQLGGVTAREFVERTQRELVELLSHEQASLAVAQRCSGFAGSTPLFTAMLNYRHSAPDPQGGWSAATGVELLALKERTNYPIAVSVDDLGEECKLTAQTDRRIDSRLLTAYLHQAMRSLVEALESKPQTSALRLSILPASERERILTRFNSSHPTCPGSKLIHELFEEQVLRTPDEKAVVYEGQSLTYTELNARANQLARYLRTKEVSTDQLVGICVERSLDMVVAMIATAKAGGAYLPLDPEYPPNRLAYMLQDANPKVVLTQQRLKERLPPSHAEVVALDQDWDCLTAFGVTNLDASMIGLQSHHLAYIIYTSGSTGLPKGVMIEHRHVANLREGLEYAYREQVPCQRVALNASINFDASVQQIVQLLVGRTLYVLPQECRRDANLLVEFIETHQIDEIDCTPSQLKSWISAGLFKSDRHQLRAVLVGGESIDADLWRTLTRNEHTKFLNVYGPTECTVDSTIAQLWYEKGSSPHIGHPMLNRRIYILDRQAEPVPVGVSGEIFIGGEGVGRGYLNRTKLTEQRFIADRFSPDPQGRMYSTGDLGRWRPDGTIEYLGRNDSQVKVRGYRIELEEIEAQLKRHHLVADAVVVAREDVPGDKRLVAYVVTNAVERKLAPNAVELRSHLLVLLPEAMVPSAFMQLERMPLTSSGKIDRRALPAPGMEAFASRQYEAPEGGVEKVVAEIWQELLSIERVGRNDDFFSLGGHSLLALRALSRITESLGTVLRVTDLYRNPTLRKLALFMDGGSSSDERVKLDQEATLDSAIIAKQKPRHGPPRAVLLTGSTGFVGRFLLAQLLQDSSATIYCLVRAQSPQQGFSRIRANLLKWDLWREEFAGRIVVVPGDLLRPSLGWQKPIYQNLSRVIDSIYHCATSMNHLETYAMAKPVNVEAARVLLKFATEQKPKLVNYISSLSVFSASTEDRPRVVHEGSLIDTEVHSTVNGYGTSKWVGEKVFLIAQERGIPCNIFRLGFIWADTRAGRYDELQHGYRVLKSSLLAGVGIIDYRYYMAPTPVDYASRAIVLLASRHPEGGRVFHISSSHQRIDDLFRRCNESCGTSLELLSAYDWICEIKRLNAMGHSLPAVPLVEFAFSMDEASYEEHERKSRLPGIVFDCTRTHDELEREGLMAPIVDDRLLRLCVESMLARDPELTDIVDSLGNSRLRQERIAGSRFHKPDETMEAARNA